MRAGARVRLEGREEPIEGMAQKTLAPGDRVIAMIRPERVRMNVAAATGGVTLAGTIVDTVFSGERVSTYIQTEIGVMTISATNAKRPSGAAATEGGSVALSWDRDDLLLFRAS